MDEFIDTTFVVHIYSFWESLVFLALLPAGFFLGKVLFDAYYRFQVPHFELNEQLVEKDNKATAIAFAGFEAGIGLIMWGAISDLTSTDHVTNMWSAIVWFFIGLFFYMIAVIANDKGMLRALTIVPEIERGNIAAGLCVAGNYFAAGLVSLYTIGGGGNNWGDNIGSAFLFFVLCQIEFFVFYYVIRFALRRYGAIDTHIRAGNVAIGTVECLCRVAMSIMATNPLRTTEELVAFFVWFACSCVVVILFEFFAFHWLLSNATIVEDVVKYNNWGAALVQGSALVMFCISCMSFLPGQCRLTSTAAAGATTLRDRLTTTDYTTKYLFRWPNAIFLIYIFVYLIAAKYIFAMPGIFHRLIDPKRTTSIPWGSAFRNYLRRPRRNRRTNEPEVVITSQSFHPGGGPAGAAVAREFEDLDDLLGDGKNSDNGEMRAAAAPPAYITPSQEAELQMTAKNDSGRISISRAASFSGYLISIGIMLRSSIAVTNMPDISASSMLLYTFYWISLGLLMQHAGYFIQRFLLWGRTHPVSGSTDAAGILDGCIYIVVAMQVGSNLMGNNEPGPFNLTQDTSVTLSFFVLQMLCVTIAGKVFQFMTSFDDIKAVVEDDNVAVATANGLGLIAAGILTQEIGARTVEMAALFAFFVPALIVSHLNRKFLVDKVIMFSRSLDEELDKDRNWGAALVSGVISCLLCACMTSFAREICPPLPVVVALLNVTNATLPPPSP